MPTTIRRLLAVALACSCAGSAVLAQPRIVLIGGGLAGGISSDGSSVVGNFSSGGRLTVGATVSSTAYPGFTPVAGSADFSYLAGSTSSGPARWSTSTGAAQQLGTFPSSNGSFSVKQISADGRYITGWGYLTGGSAFRPWIWDATAAAGAGQMVALPTFNGNGQANVVGLDGTVGGVDGCCGSANRPVVWRYDTGSSTWIETYLPFDGGASPVTGGSVEAMNPAGTVVVGSIGLSSGSIDMARWTWSSATQEWSRITIPRSAMILPTWLASGYGTTQLIPTAVSADGSTIVGITVYTLGSSFQRGGFIWSASSGFAIDFYDQLATLNTPGLAALGGSPPALGFPVAMTPNAQSMATYAGPQTGFGPPTLITLAGGPCVQPTASAVNSTSAVPAGSSAFLNCSVTGSHPLTVQWRFNGNPIVDGPNANGSTYYGATGSGTIGVQLVIGGATPADTGTYDCIITNPCGSATRPPLSLVVSSGACCSVSGTGGTVGCTVEGSSRCTGSVSVGGLGGAYLGDFVACTPTACEAVSGACCYWNGGAVACVLDITSHCTLAASSGGNGGTFLGVGVACAPSPAAACAPVSGACCYSPDGLSPVVCSYELSVRCTTTGNAGLSGVYAGNATTCTGGSQDVCPTGTPGIGACCFNATLTTDITCVVHTQAHCTGSFSASGLQGKYMGDGSACGTATCRPTVFNGLGACCYSDPANPGSGIYCSIQNATNCQNFPNGSNTNNTAPFTVGLGGVFQTGRCCQPNPSTPPTAGCATSTDCTLYSGACVHSSFNSTADVVCTLQVMARCTRQFNAGGLFGVYAGDNTTCSPAILSASAGACCYIPAGQNCAICTLQPQVMCTQVNNGGLAGSFAGLGSVCNPVPCDLHAGACCVFGNSCVISCATDCTANAGSYRGDATTCNPDPCATSGACCRGATCGITTSINCTVGSGTAGAAFALNANCGVSATAPCCHANYNKLNGITVQDIFDFLSDWFAGSRYASTGGNGGPIPLSVQNIFDFLGAWFAGGCN